MALNRSKVLDAAQKQLSKGHVDKAIKEYEKIVREDPSDVRTWLRIGDLQKRQGDPGAACATYERVAAQYAEGGFYQKAVAVYKQVLLIDQARVPVMEKLADMYEHLQLRREAVNVYEQVVVAHERAGRIDETLRTLERMGSMDPGNIAVQIKYAEVLSTAGRKEEAADAFAAGAALLKQQGRIDDYIKVAERLLFHRPTDVSVARELAVLYLKRQEAKRALQKLQLCFKAEPRNVNTLELLAQSFQMLGQTQKTISVYRELARIHHEAGNDDARATVLHRILELDPDDAEARKQLAAYAPPVSQPAPQVPRPPSVAPPPSFDARPSLNAPRGAPLTNDYEEEGVGERTEEVDLGGVVELDDGPTTLESAERYVVDRPSSIPAQTVPPHGISADTEEFEELDEFEEFEELDEVEPLSASVPAIVPAARSSIPPEVAANAQLSRLLTEIEIYQRYGLQTKIIEHGSRILDIDPNHVPAREALKDAYVAEERYEEAYTQLSALIELSMVQDPSKTAGYRAELEQMSSQVASTTREVPVAPEPVLSDAPVFMSEIEELDPVSPDEFERAPLRPSTPGEVQAARERSHHSVVEDALETAEAYIDSGNYEAARLVLAEALEEQPLHPLMREKLEQIAEMETAAISLPPAADDSSVQESFALAEQLAEELDELGEESAGSDVLDVDTVFEQFKLGVQAQIGADDSETHFDLGIAYMEMGLLDDAIGEFDIARTDPSHECTSYTMMGTCYQRKGDLESALAHFKKGLFAEHRTDREEVALSFELGAVYEQLGDKDEALGYYEKVHQRDPSFRGVAERIATLREGGSGNAPTALPDTDELDMAFENLVSKE